jgi:hypothetical protein
MTIETTECNMPAAWAPAMINGDWSGMTTPEIDACRAELSWLAGERWHVVGIDDSEGWFGRYEPPSGPAIHAALLTYTLHKVTL